MSRSVPVVRVKAPAKINLTLKVSEPRADGYHDLRTVFQSIELHDVLRFERRRGPFEIACDDTACPTDDRNLVWRAAETLWKASGARGPVRDVHVHITKRIPMQAGLGGGSSDAAAALRALVELWRPRLSFEGLRDVAASLGADVPFFLKGGTALGLGRGDILFPLADPPPLYVVLALPAFGVSTKDAYGWLDQDRRGDRREDRKEGRSAVRSTRPRDRASQATDRLVPDAWSIPSSELGNDLQGPVAARHAQIGALEASLLRNGAAGAAMSGSGSAVFGLFVSLARARAAAAAVTRSGCRAATTRTLTARRYEALAAARRLAAK